MGYKIHLEGWYLDFRIVFAPSFEHEIPNLVYNLRISLEKKFGAIVSWVLNVWFSVHGFQRECLHILLVRLRCVQLLDTVPNEQDILDHRLDFDVLSVLGAELFVDRIDSVS